MKRILTCLPIIMFLLAILSCVKDHDMQNCPCNNDTIDENTEKSLITSSNRFGFILFPKVLQSETEQKNICVSPLSISLALAMTYNGASGQTKTAMEQAMQLNGLTANQINQTFQNLSNTLIALDPSVVFTIANSIWYRNTFSVEQTFINTNTTYYNAEVNALDFNDAGSVSTINNWVADNTNNKISEIIDNISPETVMFLINAIYFKGIWSIQFDTAASYEGTFHLEDGSYKTVTFMRQDTTLLYSQNGQAEIIQLPYGNKNFNMVILLPSTDISLTDLTVNLNDSTLNSWLNNLSAVQLPLHFPKFRFEYEKSLNNILSDMGMGVAFSEAADFTGINSNGGLSISEVKHKTFIEVNEEGTEAAAVTSVEVGLTSVPPELYINRPFLFLIRENKTGVVLFIGKVGDPQY